MQDIINKNENNINSNINDINTELLRNKTLSSMNQNNINLDDYFYIYKS